MSSTNASPQLSVVIPSYLEEDNLRLLLPRLKKTLEKLKVSSQILVIDTPKARDGTPDLCREENVLYFNRSGGVDFGNAVRTGIQKLEGQYAVFMDADGSHPPEFIEKLFQKREEADVVLASRYVDGGFTENPRILILLSRVLNWSYSLVLGIPCKDVSNSFRLYRVEQLKGLVLKCQNFDIVEEILLKLCRQYDVTILEIPFTFRKRLFGESKRNLVPFILTYVFTLIRLRFS